MSDPLQTKNHPYKMAFARVKREKNYFIYQQES